MEHVVSVDRVPGFSQSRCTCGWTGIVRGKLDAALADAREHEAENVCGVSFQHLLEHPLICGAPRGHRGVHRPAAKTSAA